MNKTIAFCWRYPLHESSGGVERVTGRLIQGLSERGFDCLFIQQENTADRFLYDGQDIGDLGTFLKKRRVQTLVNQNGYSSEVTETIATSGWEGRYIICHHNEPRYLQKLFGVRRALGEVLGKNTSAKTRLAWAGRVLAYPLWRLWSSRRIGAVQAFNHRHCDHYVLLSPGFFSDFLRLIGETESRKLRAIPNPLSFDVSPDEVRRLRKSREALIVARLNDGEKRISAALRAWRIIENQDEDGWMLKILGSGPDAAALQRKASKLGLRRVEFLGHQDPLPHFRSASILLMTSRVEGWGLTLTEAMQTGTVPIAFDAYASVHDILDGDNGVIVRNGDISAFANELKVLMADSSRREALASQALTSCQRYQLEAVLDRWCEIL